MIAVADVGSWLRDGLRLPNDPERVRGIRRRTLSLFGAAALLLLVSRNAMPSVIIAAASALFIAMAAVWVRGQYEASLKTGLWTPKPLLSGLAAAAAAGSLIIGWRISLGSLVIGALVSLFFCMGYFAMGLRALPEATDRDAYRQSVRRWLCFLVAVSVLALVGLVLMDNHDAFLAVFAVSLIVLPIPVSVLTSRLERHLIPLPTGRWRAWVGFALIGGVTAVAAGAAIALSRVRDGLWMPAAIVVLALLVFALASSTYADIVAVIALIAALGVTPQQHTPEPDVPFTEPRSSVLVAFGDSYMSGEGARVFYENTDTEGNHCRRAPTAFAEMAGQLAPFNGFVSFACSGARTYNVNHDPDTADKKYPTEQYDNIETQLDAYETTQKAAEAAGGAFSPSLILVGLGGNDAGFSTIGAMCLAPGSCGGPTPSEPDAETGGRSGDGEDLLLPNLPLVEEQLRLTFDEISEAFDGVPVAVVGYPDPIYSPKTGGAEGEEAQFKKDEPAQDCGQVPLSEDDRDFIETFLNGSNGVDPDDPADDVKGLNQAVEDAATDAGFYYVAHMETSLADAHLQLCDPRNGNRPGLNIIGLQSVPGEANERFHPKNWYHNSLHPNEAGHAAMLVAFERWLEEEQATQKAQKGAANQSWFNNAVPIDPEPRTRSQATEGTDPSAVAAARTSAECLLYDPERSVTSDDSTTNAQASDLPLCENAGYRWAGGQVSTALLGGGWALIYLLIAGGAWLLSVAFFAGRKRRWRNLDGPGATPTLTESEDLSTM